MLSVCANELLYKKNNQVSFDINQEIDLEDENGITYTKGNITFTLRNSFILSKGSFISSLKLTCDRCNNSFNTELKFSIDESIEVINRKCNYQKELELKLDETFEQVLHTEKINVIDYIRQFIIINIPYKNLCSIECKNDKINALDSYKEENSIDPRWKDLLLYKDKLKENS
ncbi:MAG: hypothetical protein KatS3mg068_0458 [Candidatus Sericytochromatia bacterium]|nr:MAG: hypothetical protein KatS3mg068_0458 [Candidatus Sericytochromatia bacterium]